MKANATRLLDLLKNAPQFVIPIYQRTYSWTERECRQLWDDILRAGRSDAVTAHFIGSIVYIEKGLYTVTDHKQLLVIDGQQRLTSVSLLLEALARQVGDTEPVDGFSATELRHRYLRDLVAKGERAFKLLLTQTDKQSLLALVQQKELPDEHSLRIKENFDLFEKWLAEATARGDLPAVCKGIAKLMVVEIALDRDHDNPQLIFESMNSTGKELSQADLIRNYLLMGLEHQHQTELYADYWRPMEVEFGQEAYGTHFDSFMRHYLTFKTGTIPNVRDVYDAFKEYALGRQVPGAGVDALVKEIRDFARYYCAMALGRETDKELREAFQDLRDLRVDVAYPFLLELYADYKDNKLTKDELLKVLRLVESYVFRRAVCAIPTNSLNKTFATVGRALKKDQYVESVQAYFLLLPSYRRFPDDVEFGAALKTRDMYNPRNRSSYWLRRLENHGRKERVSLDGTTIEHILPQNPNLSQAWKDALGPEWQRVQREWLHTIGNLTLTGYNSEYSDRPFAEKRDMEKGFAHSPFYLNDGLKDVSEWNEVAIAARADQLIARAVKVWAGPVLDEQALDRYRPKVEPVEGYTIDDHQHLAGGVTRELFEAFRKAVLALDECVTEEFLKLYVAYKAETNFVDVVPQAKRLRLTLNMKFHEINDPKGLCKDVSNLGRWGNGDVEVAFESLGQLGDVMGLVRQAFEKQMGNGEGGL